MNPNQNIICFGEVLWDIYPDYKRLGGAPFNVAVHLNRLGTRSNIISKIGSDTLGEEIISAINDENINLSYIQTDINFPTGTVNVKLDEKGIPNYTINSPVAWDFIHTNLENLELVRNSSGLVFGSLACRSERNLISLKDIAKLAPLNICDLNIRQEFYTEKLIKDLLQMADILKINQEESELVSNICDIQLENFYSELSEKYNLEGIIITKGAHGAEAYFQDQIYYDPGVDIEVVDTVGSGDAFLSAFIHNYLEKKQIPVCLNEACKLGAYVATKRGAIPELNSLIEIN